MLNQAQLIGYTGAEPEIRTTTSGKKVATLRVCTSRYSKARGERKDYPTWHQVEIWTPATVNWLASKALPTGTKVFVQGEIRHDRHTDKDGVERFFSKVVVGAPGQSLTALERPEPTLAEPA
jgi:single-strand DNA-binding protein